MDFFTADICDEYPDKVYVLDGNFINYGAKEEIQGEVITLKLDRNNSGTYKNIKR